jgi:hypothetical protein
LSVEILAQKNAFNLNIVLFKSVENPYLDPNLRRRVSPQERLRFSRLGVLKAWGFKTLDVKAIVLRL